MSAIRRGGEATDRQAPLEQPEDEIRKVEPLASGDQLEDRGLEQVDAALTA